MLVELRKYQKQGALGIRKFKGRALLADEMGLGKTIQVLYWIYKMRSVRPVVIVCPACVKYNWAEEAGSKFGLETVVLEGRTPQKGKIFRIPNIIIINYDILDSWAGFLKSLNPRLIVSDECHYIKNSKTKRYKAVKKLVRSCKYFIAMSGTPLTNRPSELWTVLNLIDPKSWDNYLSYCFEYCKPRKTPWGWKFDGAVNLKRLHRKLKRSCMIRRRKKDVLKDLPDKQRSVVSVELSNKSEYRKADQAFIKWLREGSFAEASRALKAKQLSRMAKLRQLSAKLALPAIFQWIDNFLDESDKKIVIFGWHKSIIAEVAKRYEKTSVMINGTVPAKERQRIVNRFQHDEGIRVFVGNIQAAGVGITLTAAHTLAFIEVGNTPAEMSQSEARVHRFGQEEGVNIYYLVARGTIMEDAVRSIQKKQKHVDAVLDGETQDDSFDIWSQLIDEKMEKGLVI